LALRNDFVKICLASASIVLPAIEVVLHAVELCLEIWRISAQRRYNSTRRRGKL
jgi:hypothetical protein